jgi:ribosome biogenesis GTPase
MSSHSGTVLRAHSSRYAVLTEDGGVVACRARRRLRRPEPGWPDIPVPGDEVEWRLLSGAGAHREGVIEAVRPRRTEIARSRFGSRHVVLANLDQLVVVVAVRDPMLDRGLLDRLLATAERTGVPAVVCLHKADLASAAELETVRAVYEAAGYRVVITSVETGEGLEALRELLRGRVSAFMGPSGAGKSRLIKTLQPGLELRTGEVSVKTGLGRHTTSRVDLHRTDFGAILADTPGVREFNAWQLPPEELRALFPELRGLQGDCRFAACTHTHEPQCAVRAAAERGDIDPGRHRSYVALFEELREVAAAAGAGRPGRGRKERLR